VITHSILNGV